MISSSKLVPLWIRIVVGLLAALTIGFSLAPGGVQAPGLSADMSAPLNAAYLFNPRNIAIGVGILIAAVAGGPETIAAVMIVRFILEISDRVAMAPLFNELTFANVLMPLAPAFIELTIAVFMIWIVSAKRKAVAASQA